MFPECSQNVTSSPVAGQPVGDVSEGEADCQEAVGVKESTGLRGSPLFRPGETHSIKSGSMKFVMVSGRHHPVASFSPASTKKRTRIPQYRARFAEIASLTANKLRYRY